MSPTRTFTKINPTTGEPLQEYAIATEAEVTASVQQAQQAQTQWREAAPGKRAAVLKTVREQLYQQANDLAKHIVQETGKPWHDALEADIGTALNVLGFYVDRGPGILKERWIQPDFFSIITGRAHKEVRYPRGVIAIISPWNFPLAIPTSGIATALMAGNSVVLKPSEHSPETGRALVAIFQEALHQHGFSADIVQILIGDGQTGAELLAQPIDGVIFTGSDRTGKHIREQMASRGLWYSMELGGSDAMLILDGCDLDKVASYALWGRFTNSGQACAAVKRLFVPEHLEQAFLEKLTSKVTRLKIGDPMSAASHLGPLVSEAQRILLDSQVQDAIAQGAKLLTGGHSANEKGWYYEPTIFSDVPKTARLLNEEVFGPVLPVVPYQDVLAAIAKINESPYGLTASIFGPPETARAFARQIDCGTVVINDVGPSNYAMASAPWGGWKQSGSGVSHGEHALKELCRVKVISENILYNVPVLNKPLWHFGPHSHLLPARAKTVLAFAAQHRSMWNPLNWLAFWHNRASSKF